MAEKQGKRYFVWVILILLFVGLLGFGTGGLQGNIRSLGSAGGKDLSVAAYQRNLNQQIRALSAQFGTNISFQQARQFGIDQSALQQLVLTRTLDNEADVMGISVGDERIRQEVLNNPQFGGANSFNRENYGFALQQLGVTEEEYETSLREDLSRTLLQGAIVSGIPGPTAYAQTLSQYVGELRKITWAIVDDSVLTSPVPGPTDDALTAYHTENADQFTLPETRDITYVWLTPNMIQDDVTVDETALEEAYQDRIGEFVQPERRLVERLVFADADAADAAKTQIDDQSTTFDALVADRGLELSDIDLGDVSKSDLGNAGEAIFAADPGATVGPLDTDLGPALFRMNAILSAQEITFEEALPDLREEFAAARARRVIEQQFDSITDLMAGGATLEDIAERTDMVLGNINWTGEEQNDIAAYEQFRIAADEVTEGAFPEITDLNDGGIFALRLDSVTPPALQPLDEVRDAVRTAWMDDARTAAIVAKANTLADTIEPLTGFDTIGLEPRVDENLNRRSFVEETPPGFTATIFDMEQGAVQVIESAGSAIIVRVDDITAPDPEDDQTQADLESLRQSAAAGIAQDIFDAYATSVQQRTDIVLDQNVINAVNAQFQ